MLDKLQKRVCRTVGPTLASFLEPLNHRKDVASLSLFYRYYFVDVYLNWLKWFHVLFFVGSPLALLVDCMIFHLPFLDAIRISELAVSFLAQLDS